MPLLVASHDLLFYFFTILFFYLLFFFSYILLFFFLASRGGFTHTNWGNCLGGRGCDWFSANRGEVGFKQTPPLFGESVCLFEWSEVRCTFLHKIVWKPFVIHKRWKPLLPPIVSQLLLGLRLVQPPTKIWTQKLTFY